MRWRVRMRARRTVSRRRKAAASRSWSRRWRSLGAPSPSCLRSPQSQSGQFLAATAAAILLAFVGAIDDLRTLPAALRLALQFLAVGAVIAMLPGELRILPHLPWWVERACLLIGGVWFVNLVNFMDGIDWMTVAEIVPVTGAIVLLGLFGAIGPLPSHGRRRAAGRDRSALRRSTSRSPSSFWATSAACRSVFCSAGCCSSSRRTAIWRRRSSSRSIISPMRPSRSPAASPRASRSGRRIARTSISARPTTASPFRKSSPACLLVNLGLARSRSSPSRPTLVVSRRRSGRAALVAWLLATFARGKR